MLAPSRRKHSAKALIMDIGRQSRTVQISAVPRDRTVKTPTCEMYSPPPRQELCFVFPAPPFNLIHVCRESRGHIIKHESYRRLCLSKVPDEPYALINFDIDILDAGLFTVDYFLRLVLLSVA
ncbi:uncharacterized protein LMH87_008123 [Akanthomyces muscarius]|uniref:Uncharacterized protein n=1 Tax=Akanthomyces muscarius TaxID=2231603 RepID=A0A9W8QIP4_AKAMU|nr:uncharacterized protein LMH87_008123 [Akanthomyces muscarius]KAJ4159215.1 hypothetical protein LMH87_008123 [Akanthomyces muscarius]